MKLRFVVLDIERDTVALPSDCVRVVTLERSTFWYTNRAGGPAGKEVLNIWYEAP